MKFKFLKHTADIKFRAFGRNLEEVFKNSALAMFSSMYNGKVKAVIRKKIKIKGKDMESLLYNFLEELLFLFDTEGFFPAKVSKIKIEEKNRKFFTSFKTRNNKNPWFLSAQKIRNFRAFEDCKKFVLEAEVIGDDAQNYKIYLDVKAVTYNQMFIRQEKNKWVAQVVVDV